MTETVKAFFDALAERVDRAWRANSYDDSAFSDVAVRCLEQARPAEQVAPGAIIDWVVSGGLLPQQLDPLSGFGNPPVQLAVQDRFYIEALFWTDGTTSIHDHSFSGAFTVLAGSSLHSTFTFEPGRRINRDLELGALEWKNSELLERGQIRPIVAGRDMLHSLFHLDRPSVSVVVRTHREELPQFNYTQPGIAERFRAETNEFLVRQRMLGLLRQTDGARFALARAKLLAECDLAEAVRLLNDWARSGLEQDALDEGHAILAARDAELARYCQGAGYEALRVAQLAAWRGSVRDVGQRFLLALLMNLRSRGPLLQAVRARFGDDDAAARICTWIGQMRDVMRLEATPGELFALQRALEGEQVNSTDLAGLKKQTVLDPLFR